MPPVLLEGRNLGRRLNAPVEGQRVAQAVRTGAPASDRWLLRHVNISVEAGGIVGVRGPSGAGKTLLLRALARLDALDEGEVLWRGQAVQGDAVPTMRRRVVYLHAQPVFNTGTVLEAIRAPTRWRSSGDGLNEATLARLTEEAGQEESFLQKPTTHLSGGEAQLAALLRGLCRGPEVLLLDEPTSAMDGAASLRVEALLRAWLEEAASERALLWVSHDEEQRQRVCTRSLHVVAGGVSSGDGEES